MAIKEKQRFYTAARLISFTGFSLLAMMVILLLTACVLETLQMPKRYPLVLSIMVAMFPTVIVTRRKLSSGIIEAVDSIGWSLQDLTNILAVVFGGMLCYMLSNDLALGAVVASGLVGVVAALVLARYGVPIFCGSFVGMACATVLTTHFHILLASTIAGVLFVMTKYTFNGLGGKLGTIAFLGCLTAALLTKSPLAEAAVPDWSIGSYLVVYSVLGALITYILNIRFKHSAVLSSGIVGLIAGLILPVIHPENGTSYAVMAFCASFAGMSSRHRVKNEFVVIFIGVLCALIFIFSSPYFGGAGGKLGTIAFSSVIITAAIGKFRELFAVR